LLVAVNPATGFDSPELQGAQPRRNAVFLRAQHGILYGRAVRGAARLAGFLVSGLSTRTVPPTSFDSGEAENTTAYKE
jgi:hypothetical protein